MGDDILILKISFTKIFNRFVFVRILYIWSMIRRDPFGNKLFLKRMLVTTIGWLTWARYTRRNKIQISGTENLKHLANTNVLFVSNHQTYFAEVIAMLHVFCSVKHGYENSINRPWYLFRPRVNTYFVAAEETMKSGFLPKVFAYAGSVSIQRTWRDAGTDINRKVRMEDLSNIGLALKDGWVINFPQGTTKVYAKGRRGITLLVKKFNPIVIPVVIDGFREAFDGKGLVLKQKGGQLSIKFKSPLQFDVDESGDSILEKIMFAIEQTDEFFVAAKALDEQQIEKAV